MTGYPYPHSYRLHPSSYFAGAYLPPHPVEGPPPCPDGYDLDPETQKCVAQSLGWPYESPPPDDARVGFDWSKLALPMVPIAEAERDFLRADSRGSAGPSGGTGGDGGDGGGGFDWKGVLEWGAIAAAVVGGFFLYEMIQTQRATSAGALRGLLAAAEERGG